jgi:hypothetical protein
LGRSGRMFESCHTDQMFLLNTYMRD